MNSWAAIGATRAAQLARLDIRLNAVYRSRMDLLTGNLRDDFARVSSARVAKRDRQCVGTSLRRKSCLLAEMQSRIVDLQEASSAAYEPQNFRKPSWCAKVRGNNPNETHICSDAELTRLDNNIN